MFLDIFNAITNVAIRKVLHDNPDETDKHKLFQLVEAEADKISEQYMDKIMQKVTENFVSIKDMKEGDKNVYYIQEEPIGETFRRIEASAGLNIRY